VDTTLHTVGGDKDTQKFIKFRLSHWMQPDAHSGHPVESLLEQKAISDKGG
jgi:hypothetical protein